MKKLHTKNKLSIGCDPWPRHLSLIWALFLSLLVVGLDRKLKVCLKKQVPRGKKGLFDT
jgi:hypothetical protein